MLKFLNKQLEIMLLQAENSYYIRDLLDSPALDIVNSQDLAYTMHRLGIKEDLILEFYLGTQIFLFVLFIRELRDVQQYRDQQICMLAVVLDYWI